MDISKWFETYHDATPDMVMGAYVTPGKYAYVFGESINSTLNAPGFTASRGDDSREFILVLMGGYQYTSKTYPGPREAEYAAAECLKKLRGEDDDDTSK